MCDSSLTHTIYDGIDVEDIDYNPNTIRSEIEKMRKSVELAEYIMNDCSNSNDDAEELNDSIQDFLEKKQKLDYLIMLSETYDKNS